MRLIGSRSVLYILSILHCLIETSNGRPSNGQLDHESRLIPRQQLDIPRKIILVADKFLEGPVAASASSDDSESWEGRGAPTADEGETQADEELVYPVHSWIYYNETATEGALRVELVAPVTVSVEGMLKPGGLAIAVTDYGKSRYDTGVPGHPSQPRNTIRSHHMFSESISITNDGIFNVNGLLAAALEPDSEFARHQVRPGLVEAKWLRSSLQWDAPEQHDWQVDRPFGSAIEFSYAMLSEWIGRGFLANGAQLAEGILPLMSEGEEWAQSMRRNTRTVELGSDEDEAELGSAGEPLRGDFSCGEIDYLFYEAVASSSRRKSGVRVVFEIDKTSDPQRYSMRRVTDKQWARRWVAEVASPTSFTERPVRTQRAAGVAIELSRDARLTSDILPLDKRGSLQEVP